MLKAIRRWCLSRPGKSPKPLGDGTFRQQRAAIADEVEKYRAYDYDEKAFPRGKDYLGAVDETGQKPMPKKVFAGVLIGLGGEGFFISLTMLPWVSQLITEEMKHAVAGIMGIVFATALFKLCIWIGNSLRYHGKVKLAGDLMRRAQQSAAPGEELPALMPEGEVGLANSEIDRGRPPWQRMMHRLKWPNAHFEPNFWPARAGLVALLVFDLAVLGIRLTTGEAVGGDYDFGGAVAADGWSSNTEMGMLATNLLLLLVLGMIQALAVAAGYEYGFSGKESAEAYAIVKGFKSAEEYEKFHAHKRIAIAAKGDARLSSVGARIHRAMEKSGADGTAPYRAAATFNERDFMYFVREAQMAEHQDRLASIKEWRDRKHAQHETTAQATT